MATKRSKPLNLKSFVAVLDRSIPLIENRMTKIVQRVAFDAAENIIVGGRVAPGTPVDTGFARASWYVSINDRYTHGARGDSGGHLTHDKSGQTALSTSLSVIGAAKLGNVIWLLNNVPYVISLEYGHSDQAPTGMVRLTLHAGQQLLDHAAAVEMKR